MVGFVRLEGLSNAAFNGKFSRIGSLFDEKRQLLIVELQVDEVASHLS
jgi:hypothetical protein